MKSVYAYIRVSTQKQGTQGSSLKEQRTAIEAYARRNNLAIQEWFEETETAAKRGRPAFSRMIRALAKQQAQGVIIHKIDRSARNLRDWSDLGDLLDRGVDVHFAHETLDMRSRGGRLAADIQAVVAADFIRNLRDEVRKGQLGRLRQGIYPFEAPTGYRNMGRGEPKAPDPVQGPLVRQMFELYATGDYNLRTLRQEMDRRGLRGRIGNRITIDGLSRMLNNPFYIGIIHLKSTGESFQGAHAPLIRKELFDRAQTVLRGNRLAGASWKHDFLFRRLIRCKHCGRTLIGERQKRRYVYYRCHNPPCGIVCLSERKITDRFSSLFRRLAHDDVDRVDLRDMLEKLKQGASADKVQRSGALKLALAKCDERLSRLTDAYLDGVLDKDMLDSKKASLLSERRQLLDRLEGSASEPGISDLVSAYVELSNTAYLQYQSASPQEIRDIVCRTTSNLSGSGNEPEITLKSPFREMLEITNPERSAPRRDDGRTMAREVFEVCMRAAVQHFPRSPEVHAGRSHST